MLIRVSNPPGRLAFFTGMLGESGRLSLTSIFLFNFAHFRTKPFVLTLEGVDSFSEKTNSGVWLLWKGGT